MAKVYVTQAQPGRDLSQANIFGEVVSIFPGSLQVYNNIEEAVKTARERLAGATPEDYWLPIGDPILIGLTFSEMVDATGGQFRILKWDKRARDGFGAYHPVKIDMGFEQ
jgi:hypothetical protein